MSEPADSYCRPYTTSFYAVEHAWASQGIGAEIRRFGWDHSCDGTFQANAYYVDCSLGPRSPASRLLYGGRRDTPPPGGSVFLPRGSVFEAHIDPCEQRLLCITFGQERARDLFEEDRFLEPCFDVQAPQLQPIFARLAAEIRAPGFGSDILLESLALGLAVELCRYLRGRGRRDAAPSGGMAQWRLARLRERIAAGLSSELSVAGLAAESGLSARHLIRTFKATTGSTLSDCIAEARLQRARGLLTQGDTPIKVVAAQCGFASPAAFSAAFRRVAGSTPSAFRQDHRSKVACAR